MKEAGAGPGGEGKLPREEQGSNPKYPCTVLSGEKILRPGKNKRKRKQIREKRKRRNKNIHSRNSLILKDRDK